jgi:hypothetical protein
MVATELLTLSTLAYSLVAVTSKYACYIRQA